MKLAGYEVIRKIASGGMSDVFQAKRLYDNKLIAIKLINSHISKNTEAVKRFYAEAELVMGLNHPNIVEVFSLERNKKTPFITMEYIEGKTLRELLNKKRLLDNQTIINISLDITKGLEYIHSKGIIHKDIKPKNILITNTTAKISDFGIASYGLTAYSHRQGAPSYMSPEQIKGRDIDHRTDIYSLGITMYEMATGQVPFKGSGDREILTKHLGLKPRSIKQINSEIHPNIESTIMKMLEKLPANRYQTASMLQLDLLEINMELS
ncbi:MAG: serine/threonine-protein kinase [bacterium]|nr:serine/threonine-protein kinase [bacterium]